jgi:hypothetical protein
MTTTDKWESDPFASERKVIQVGPLFGQVERTEGGWDWLAAVPALGEPNTWERGTADDEATAKARALDALRAKLDAWRAALAVLVLMVLFFVSPAAAQTCEESFPARLVDAKDAVAKYETHMRLYTEAKPALEWFEAHCRFLEELERVVRKEDDPNAFVCDPKAKGRPKNLTSELVLTFSTLPTVGSYQERSGDNYRCEADDTAKRIVLIDPVLDPKLSLAWRLEVMCWEDQREKCTKVREMVAQLRAKGAAP